MKKLSKAILLGVGALLVLGIGGIFCANLYVQSPGTQERIQAQLSQALRMPLKITHTGFSLWSGLRITGITIPQGDATFLEAGSFTASYRMLPLLAGKLSVPEMRVDRPKIVWKQNAKGKWKLPAREKDAAAAPDPQPADGAAPPQEAKPKAAASPEKKKAGGKIIVDVARLLVTGGTVELLDKEGQPAATFTDVNLTCTTLTEAKVEGLAVIGRLVWAESLVLENVRTPFIWIAGELTLPELTGTLAGGSVRGRFHAQPDAPKSPFEAVLNFEQVNLDRLATEGGGKQGQTTGTGGGQLALNGDLGRIERATGTGQFQIRDGRFKQLELFQTIGRLLDIRELSDLRIKDGRGDFHIADEKIQVDEMILTAPDLQLSSKKGTVRFDKKVEIEAQLGLAEGLVKQLPDLILGSFATADNGQRTIDFKITGTTDKLRTDLPDRLIGQKIGRQFEDLLTGIFGGKSKDDEKKKKEEEERKKEEKKRKKEQEKAAAKAAAKAAGAPAATPPAATPPPPEPPTTAITPAKP